MSAPGEAGSPAPGSKLAPLQGSHRPWGPTDSRIKARQRRHRDAGFADLFRPLHPVRRRAREFNHESLISTGGEDGAFEAECRGPG